MTLAQVKNNAASELPYGQEVVFDDGTHTSYASVEIWSEAERNTLGIFTVAISAQPTYDPLTQLCTQDAAPREA